MLSTRFLHDWGQRSRSQLPKSSMLQFPTIRCIQTRNMKQCWRYVGDTIFQVLRPDVEVTVT